MFWFRDKYNMPPGDPRYLCLTMEEIETDYWAHHYYRNPTADSFETDEWNSEEMIEAMNSGDWEEVINEQN